MTTRIAPRKSFQTRVIFEDEFGGEFLYFVSQDLSTSGLFIRTALPFKAGTKVFLRFPLEDATPPIRVAAEIRRFHDRKRGPGRKKPVATGVGLKFLSLTRSDLLRIEKFIGE